MAYEPLLQELVARGHQLTVISAFPQNEPIANYTDVVFPKVYDAATSFSDIYAMRDENRIKILTLAFQKLNAICESIITSPGVQNLINAKNSHFDVILFDNSAYECTLGLVHRFQAPFIGLTPYRAHSVVLDDIVGTSAFYSYDPNLSSAYSDRMTFPERLDNTVTSTLLKVARRLLLIPYSDLLMRKHFSDSTLPYVGDIGRSVSLVFVLSHPMLDYPKPFVPAVKTFSLLNTRATRNLPTDLQTFLDEATEGVIYFSFGSIADTRLFTTPLRDEFVSAFTWMKKQRVLWVWNGDMIPDLSPNIWVEKWVPQLDVLAHPNIRVFLTHGGLNGMFESIYHGVPMVGIPIFADQFSNLRLAQDRGFAVSIDLSTVTNQTLIWALDAVLNNPSYREKARRASVIYRDNLQPSLEKAVYWVEFVVRHKGAAHLRVAAMDLYWFQFYLLDMVIVVIGAVYVVYKVFRAIVGFTFIT